MALISYLVGNVGLSMESQISDLWSSFLPSHFSPPHARARLLNRPLALHILSFPAVMPSLMHFTLALALTSLVLAEHGHHGRPMARQIVHGSLNNGLFQSGYWNTSRQSATATGSRGPTHVSAPILTAMPASSCNYWLQDIDHQGFSPFNANPTTYQVFRNVKDFGAAGGSS